jgi:hypothetical protein
VLGYELCPQLFKLISILVTSHERRRCQSVLSRFTTGLPPGLVETYWTRMADGREVPEPKGKRSVLVTLPMQTSLKVELYRLLTRENVTRAELMRRLNWKRESVDRLFRLNHATRLEQFDAAFRALGHRVGISVH